jgi:hypothetical protein
MIRVGEVALTEEEWALGQSVTDDEFWQRYGTAPSGMRGPVLAQGHSGRPARGAQPHGADSEAPGMAGSAKAQAADAGGVDEASDWIGDSCRAIDRRVYG